MSASDLVAQLAAAGTPPELLAAVAKELFAGEIERGQLADRRKNERENSARYRQRGGDNIPIELRQEVFERDNFQCQECGSGDHLQCDHVIPLIKDGQTTLENLQVLCRPCNARKKDRLRKTPSSPEFHGKAGKSTGRVSLDKESPQTPKKIISSPGLDSLPACEDLDFPEGIGPDLWVQYRAMRKKIRKPLNANAERLALKHLRQFAEDGHPPGEIVEAAIVGSYQGLFPVKGSKNGQQQPHPRPAEHQWGRTVAAADALIDELRAQGTQHG